MNKPSEPEFLIEIASLPVGVIPQDAAERIVEATPEHIEKIGELAQWVGDTVISKMKSMLVPPTEFELEFGANASGEAGVPLVTKGTVGANFKIKVTWKTNEPKGT